MVRTRRGSYYMPRRFAGLLPNILKKTTYQARMRLHTASLDIWTCTLHSLTGHGVSSKGILYVFVGIISRKNTLPYSKDRLYLLRRVCCISVLNTLFVGRYAYVILLKTSSIFSRNGVSIKGHCSICLIINGRVNTWTHLQAIHTL